MVDNYAAIVSGRKLVDVLFFDSREPLSVEATVQGALNAAALWGMAKVVVWKRTVLPVEMQRLVRQVGSTV